MRRATFPRPVPVQVHGSPVAPHARAAAGERRPLVGFGPVRRW